jgi:hypothetical protein
MNPPFLVCTAGRARTKWLSMLLTFDAWSCHCEVAVGMRAVGDIARFFARPCVGSVETAAAPGWDLVRHYVPTIRGVVVRRPVEEAIASMCAALDGQVAYDLDTLRRNMRYGGRALDRMALTPGVLAVEFADLDREDVCAAIFEHCLGMTLPHDHWAALRGRNIQIGPVTLFRYYLQYRDEIERFKRRCRSDLRGLMRSGAIARSAACRAASEVV